MKHPLSPINPPFNPEISTALEAYPKQDGYLLTLFRVFANSARFLTGKGVVNLLDQGSPISLKERELVILRTCSRNNCEYEWGVHVAVFSEKAGLTSSQVTMTKLGDSHSDCWNESERLLIMIVDELCNTGELINTTQSLFQNHWNTKQQLEILALIGNYHTVSFVANVAKLSRESFAAKFPTSAQA
jgi:alkylhydroperoxidase family enzyme